MIPPALLAQLDRLSLVSSRRYATAAVGGRRSRARGSSVEFVEYRGYVAGDDLRRIDWNLYGRTNELFLKQFEDERALTVHVLVDTSASMDIGAPNKLRFAAQLAAALGYVGLARFDVLTVGALSDEARILFGPTRGRDRAPALLRALGGLAGHGESNFATAIGAYTQQQRRPGLVIVISDLLSPSWEEGLRQLIAHRNEIVLLHVLAPDELAPEAAEEVRLLDRENGRTLEVRLDAAAIARYRQRLGTWLAAIEALCRRASIRYEQFSTVTPLADALLQRLRVGGVLK